MADLLSICWAAINPALEGLAQNRVKRFFHIEIENRVCDSKYNRIDESSQSILFLLLLQDNGC